MYPNFYNSPDYRSQLSSSSLSNSNSMSSLGSMNSLSSMNGMNSYGSMNSMNSDRFVAGGFLAPFLLGGITGGLLAPAFNSRPYYYNNYYYPYPYYGPYYR